MKGWPIPTASFLSYMNNPYIFSSLKLSVNFLTWVTFCRFVEPAPSFCLLSLSHLTSMYTDGYTALVTNLSPRATENDVHNFFAYCGPIEHVEIIR